MIKNLQLLIILLLSISSLLFSQTFVNPGDGTLAEAILNAADGDVLLLQSGAEYTETTNAVFGNLDKSLTIQVDGDEFSDKAILKILNTDVESDNKYFYASNGSSLTLKGIEFDGSLDGTPSTINLVQFDAGDIPDVTNVGTIRIENCYVHDLAEDVINGGSSSLTGWVTVDSVFIDNSIMHNTHTIVYTKYVALRFMSITNSTFYDGNSYGVRITGFSSNGILGVATRAVIDRTTWYNWGIGDDQREMLLLEAGPNTEPWLVTNSIFAKQVSTSKTVINIKETTSDSLATITNICLWEVGKKVWKAHSLVDTLIEVYEPEFADPENGDFTLAEGSQLLIYASDGGAIGDPRWTENAPEVSVEAINNSIPSSFVLKQNYPNPFNPSTSISFSLPNEGMTKLVVHDILGNEVASLVDESLAAGNYDVKFNASKLPSGIYIYSLKSSHQIISKKMMLVK